MANLKVGNGTVRLGVGGMTSYKTGQSAVKTTSSQRTTALASQQNTSLVVGTKKPGYKTPLNKIIERQHVNVPQEHVFGVGPYVGGPPPTPISTGNPFVYYGSVSLVPANHETTVVNYITTNNQVLYLQGFQGCGDADGMYTLYVDNLVVAKSRTTPANLNAYLNLLNGTPVVQPGKSIKLTVICIVGGCDFYGTLIGQYDAY